VGEERLDPDLPAMMSFAATVAGAYAAYEAEGAKAASGSPASFGEGGNGGAGAASQSSTQNDLRLGQNTTITGTQGDQEAIVRDLGRVTQTDSGAVTYGAVNNAPHVKIAIEPTKGSNSTRVIWYERTRPDGSIVGRRSEVVIRSNPNKTSTTLGRRPPYIGLAHEIGEVYSTTMIGPSYSGRPLYFHNLAIGVENSVRRDAGLKGRRYEY